MTYEPDLPAWEIFRAALGENSPVMQFARGVALHLEGSGWLELDGDLIALTVDLLQAVVNDMVPPPEKLAASPVLLASFFQNLDLLPPQAWETMQVAILVAGAMEIVGAGNE